MSNFLNEHVEDYQILTEGSGDSKQYYLDGIFMQSGVVNKNGRLYQPHEFKEQIEIYNNEKVSKNTALGELDHPSCFLESFQVLTENGWLDFENVNYGHKIATLNIENNEIEYNSINRIINEQYKGHAYSIEGRNIKTKVTPTHRFLLEDRYGKRSYHTIEEIFLNRKKFNKHKILKNGNLCGEISTTNEIYLDDSFLKIEKINHDGNVFCFNVDNSNFFIKQNNKTFITGNSAGMNLHRISHIFETPLRFENNNIVGKARILDTQYGKTVKVLIDEKIPFGVSSRGTGNLKRLDEYNLVQGFKLITVADIVNNPSAPDAFPKTIIEMIMENDKRVEKIYNDIILNDVKKVIHNTPKTELDEEIKRQYNKIINNLD